MNLPNIVSIIFCFRRSCCPERILTGKLTSSELVQTRAKSARLIADQLLFPE